ncbi:hypothetical protein FQN49_005945 [Arthroderma sp. PD_2]|nr:hypothetical protein FQN49_005945 [Arthroderma sp. PD_2]
MTTPAIAIIGAGPCGLTLARLLDCKGIDYVIYERDEREHSDRAGGSLDIHAETGQQALRDAGLFDEFKRYARYDDTAFALADRLGNTVVQMGQGRDAPEIDRGELRQILLDSIPEDNIKWGNALKSASVGEDGRPVLQFSDGAVLSGFKLVVGADGAWSKVRKVLTQATPQYSGKSFLESKIGLDNPLYETIASKIGPGMLMSIGSGKLIVTQRQGNGSYRNYTGLQIPEDYFRNGTVDLQDVKATRNLLQSDFYADWSEEHKKLIQHATHFRPWPLYSLSTEDLAWKSVPGFTIVGDAAHVTIPNGKGVNLAMTDALKLVAKITEHGSENLDRAVQEYEAEMFPRGIDMIEDGKEMADAIFSEGPEVTWKLMTQKGAK